MGAPTNKINFSRSGIVVTCQRNDHHTFNKMMMFNPVHKNRINTEFRVSIRQTPEILKLLRGIDSVSIGEAPLRIQEFYFNEVNARIQVDELQKYGPVEDSKINESLTLRPHQQLAREIAKIRDRYGFFYDTRTGKTPLALSIINDDLVRNPGHRWLVVCPLVLIDNAWIEDAKRFFPTMPILSLHASTKAKRLKLMDTPAQVYVTNTESFINYKDEFVAMGFNGCFLDESSSMKASSSKFSKAMVEFSQQMERFYLLSGTPAPNGEYEYYRQLQAIDYYSFQESYNQFKQYFFANLSYNPQYDDLVLRPDKKEEFFRILKQYCIYVDKEDVLETPGRTFEPVLIDMPDKLRKQYNKVKNELYLELTENNEPVVITAPSIATKMGKLNQITSGFIIDTKAMQSNDVDDGDRTELYELDNYRFAILMGLLKRFEGQQVIIWAHFRHEFTIIKDLLGYKCGLVYGGVGINIKNEAIQRFKSKELQYLVANPASADKGLTLTNCHINVYFSLGYSYETFKQSAERIYGDKSIQPYHCMYYILMAKGTIDEVIYNDVLQGKRDASTAVLNHLKTGETPGVQGLVY